MRVFLPGKGVIAAFCGRRGEDAGPGMPVQNRHAQQVIMIADGAGEVKEYEGYF